MRFLVVGAGASIEEYIRLKGNPSEVFPTISNFANCMFSEGYVINLLIARYLDTYDIPYSSKILESYEKPTGIKLNEYEQENKPINVFCKLEKESPEIHNVERLFEFAWNVCRLTNPEIWDDFIRHSIYGGIFNRFVKVSFEQGVGYKEMLAGKQVAKYLTIDDVVLNLNYDPLFDLALLQMFKNLCYSPGFEKNSITIYKPHGSINLYVNSTLGRFKFVPPDKIPGGIIYPDPNGGEWSNSLSIVPPRLNKKYNQHPISSAILNNISKIKPTTVTFWGVGLTDSDINLTKIYKDAIQYSKKIELINPSIEVFEKAQSVLGIPITYYKDLDSWEKDQ